MKKVVGGLVILLIAGLVLAACSNPVNFSGGKYRGASGSTIVWNGAADRAAAVTMGAVINDTRKNASGPKITSNAHSADFPGIYFIWDSKQSDSGYLKVKASLLEQYESFVLTAKVSNTYWDFVISLQDGQEITADNCFVFFIPKVQEVGKNINMVFVSEFKEKPLVAQALDFTENPVDVPNPDRGYEQGNDDAAGQNLYAYMTLPVDADSMIGQEFRWYYEDVQRPNLGNSSTRYQARITQFYLCLSHFSSNAWTNSSYTSGSAHTAVGEDGPLTDYALNYLREQLTFIRDNTNTVLHIRPNYDPKGWNQLVWNPTNVDLENLSAPGAGRAIGSSPIYRMCTVPGYEHLNWVQYHYLQLKPIFQEFADIIWAFDHGTFGPWGESHSNYDAEDPDNYKIVLDSLLDMVPDGKPIITHVGAFLAWYNRTYNTSYDFGTLETLPFREHGTPEARFGLYDDMYGSGWSGDEWVYNDDGSLSEGYRMLAYDPTLPGFDPNAPVEVAREEYRTGVNTTTNRLLKHPQNLNSQWRPCWFADWDRTKTIRWAREGIFGGENNPTNTTSTGGTTYGTSSAVNNVYRHPASNIYESALGRAAYLCSQQGSGNFQAKQNFLYTRANIELELTYPHNGKTVQIIFDPVYEGKTTLEYYRDRLGFRLVLREANANEWVAQDGTLKFEGKIQNVGWGNVYNRKAVKVILKSDDYESAAVLTGIDPWDWQTAPLGPNDEMPDSRASNTDAWHDLSFQIPMSSFGNVPAGEYGIYLKINDPKEKSVYKRSIRFANNGDDIWDESIGANLIGYVEVK